MLKQNRYFIPILFSICSSLSLYAGNNYYCTYHTQNSCTSTEYNPTGSYTTQSSILSTSSEYTASATGISTSSSSGGGSSEEGGSSNTRASIAIAYVNSNDTSITVLPASFDATQSLSFTGSVSYVDDTLTGQKGMGDSSLGFSYKFGIPKISGAEIGAASNDSSYIIFSTSLSLPTGNKSKGLSLNLYTTTVGVGFSKKIEQLNSRLFLNYYHNTVLNIPEFNFLDVIHYTDKDVIYGDKKITILGYDQMLTSITQLNLKYLFLNAESTTINSIDQRDQTQYEDMSVGFSLSLGFAALSAGVLIPMDESYGPSITSPTKRENIYYVSLSKAF